MGTRKQFTPELKREAVQLLESGNRLWSSSRPARLSIQRQEPWRNLVAGTGMQCSPWAVSSPETR